MNTESLPPCVIHKTTEKFRHHIRFSINNIIMIQEAFLLRMVFVNFLNIKENN